MKYTRLEETDKPLTTRENKIIREQFPISKMSPRYVSLKHRATVLNFTPPTKDYFYKRFYNLITSIAEKMSVEPSTLLSKVEVVSNDMYIYSHFYLILTDRHTKHKNLKHMLSDLRLKEGMKTCTTCKRKLPLTDFYQDPTTLDGYKSRCKFCYQQYQKDYRKYRKETDHD